MLTYAQVLSPNLCATLASKGILCKKRVHSQLSVHLPPNTEYTCVSYSLGNHTVRNENVFLVTRSRSNLLWVMSSLTESTIPAIHECGTVKRRFVFCYYKNLKRLHLRWIYQAYGNSVRRMKSWEYWNWGVAWLGGSSLSRFGDTETGTDDGHTDGWTSTSGTQQSREHSIESSLERVR
jgi:hypothetical protein